jgi:PEP-CTERM motif
VHRWPEHGGRRGAASDVPEVIRAALNSLGITDAAQIGILFDAVQPQNTGNITVTITDLTLKLYNAAGTTLLGTAVLSPEPLTLATNPGNGMTDYLFELNGLEAAEFNSLIAGNFADIISLNSTISFPNQSSGADSYALVDTGTTPITPAPEPTSLALIGSALAGLGLMHRRRS